MELITLIYAYRPMETIVGSIVVGYLLFGLITFIFVKKKAKRYIVLLTPFAIVLLWYVFNKISGSQWENNKEQEIAVYRANLQQACKSEKLHVFQKIPKKSGFYLKKSALPVSITSDKFEVLVEACVKKDSKQLGEPMARRFCEEKYRDWSGLGGDAADTNILRHTGASLLEKRKKADFNKRGWHEKYFPTTHLFQDYIYQRSASKEWFQSSGQDKILEEYEEYYQLDDYADSEIIPVSLPALTSMAQYQFTEDNLSTLADYDKGIRRLKITLLEIKTQKIIATYDTYYTSLTRVYDDEFVESCANLAHKRTEESGALFAYFFEKVIDKSKIAKLPTNVPYP